MAADFKKAYAEKMKDPRWQKLRLQVFERDEWRCVRCGAEDKTLHVHHLAYLKNAEPWDTPIFALSTRCETCHESETDGKEDVDRLMFVLRSMFPVNEAREMLSEIWNALVGKGVSLSGVSIAMFEAVENLPDLRNEHGRTSGPAVPGVPEASSEGGCQEGNHEGAAEGGIRDSTGRSGRVCEGVQVERNREGFHSLPGDMVQPGAVGR
jgi:hypothetical protein